MKLFSRYVRFGACTLGKEHTPYCTTQGSGPRFRYVPRMKLYTSAVHGAYGVCLGIAGAAHES